MEIFSEVSYSVDDKMIFDLYEASAKGLVIHSPKNKVWVLDCHMFPGDDDPIRYIFGSKVEALEEILSYCKI